MSKHSFSMTEGPALKQIVLFAIPIIATNFLNGLYNTADMIVVGQFAGSDALAAVGTCNPIVNLLFSLFLGLSMGAGVLVSRYYGANDPEQISKTVHTACVLSVLLGAVLTVAGILIAPRMLHTIGAPPEIFDASTLYLRIFFAGTIPNLTYNFMASILRAAGDSKSPLVFLMVSCVVNILLNILFVAGFHTGVIGVAIATVISQCVSAVMAAITLLRTASPHKLLPKNLRLLKEPCIDIIKIGLPAGISSALFSISNLIVSAAINSFENTALIAGHTASGQPEAYLFYIVNGLANALLTFAGQNSGAGQHRRILNGTNQCALLCGGIVLALGLFCIFFASPVLSLFNDNPAVIFWGKKKLYILASCYFLYGMYECYSAAIKGCGTTLIPMLISVFGICMVRIAWIFIALPICRTVETIYFTYPVSYALTLGLTFLYYKYRRKHWLYLR